MKLLQMSISLMFLLYIGISSALAESNIAVDKKINPLLLNVENQSDLFKSYKGFPDIDVKFDKENLVENAQLANQIDEDIFMAVSNAKKLKVAEPLNFANSRGVKEIQLFKNVAPSVVLVLTKDSIGSGSLLNSGGDIITNNHVVGNNKQVLVALKPKSGSTPERKDLLIADVRRINQTSDLALIQLRKSSKKFRTIKLGKANSYQIGQDVHAIGHPQGNLWTYTKGFISQVRDNYSWTSGGTLQHHAKIIVQTQTPINPGNSGGPLLDDKGTLIAVNSFKKAGGEGLNYAVSIEDVKIFLKQEGNTYAKRVESVEDRLSKKFNVHVLKVTKVDYLKKGQKNDVMVVYDQNNNNIADSIAVDIGSTSFFEIFIYDKDENGMPERMTIDTTKSGKPNIYLADTNNDGKYNVRGYDDDEDGKIDRFEDI